MGELFVLIFLNEYTIITIGFIAILLNFYLYKQQIKLKDSMDEITKIKSKLDNLKR